MFKNTPKFLNNDNECMVTGDVVMDKRNKKKKVEKKSAGQSTKKKTPKRTIKSAPSIKKTQTSPKNLIEENEEARRVVSTPDQQRTAILGRCVGRTFNYEEAQGICQQFEVAGYETSIIQKKQGGLVLYEVWATKKDGLIL